MDSSPSTILLVTLLLSCGYLHHRATRPPNPNPKTTNAKDTIKVFLRKPTYLPWIQGVLWIWEIALILFPESEQRAKICLNPGLLNQALFSWSPYSISYITAVFIAAPLRILAYAQLGTNFTFQLAKPTGLVKTGLYRYMQHPSYTALLTLLIADVLYLFRADGLPACIFPQWIVQIRGLSGLAAFLFIGFVGTGGILRIKDEEEMLRQAFGKEWEEYHRTTKRLIPFVF